MFLSRLASPPFIQVAAVQLSTGQGGTWPLSAMAGGSWTEVSLPQEQSGGENKFALSPNTAEDCLPAGTATLHLLHKST